MRAWDTYYKLENFDHTVVHLEVVLMYSYSKYSLLQRLLQQWHMGRMNRAWRMNRAVAEGIIGIKA